MICEEAFRQRVLVSNEASIEKIQQLENDTAFLEASQIGTARTVNVKSRLDRARAIFSNQPQQ